MVFVNFTLLAGYCAASLVLAVFVWKVLPRFDWSNPAMLAQPLKRRIRQVDPDDGVAKGATDLAGNVMSAMSPGLLVLLASSGLACLGVWVGAILIPAMVISVPTATFVHKLVLIVIAGSWAAIFGRTTYVLGQAALGLTVLFLVVAVVAAPFLWALGVNPLTWLNGTPTHSKPPIPIEANSFGARYAYNECTLKGALLEFGTSDFDAQCSRESSALQATSKIAGYWMGTANCAPKSISFGITIYVRGDTRLGGTIEYSAYATKQVTHAELFGTVGSGSSSKKRLFRW